MERLIVAKFGGSSMADVDSVRRAANIILSNPDRRFIVVSAPGRNHAYSQKITDLLIIAYSGERRIGRRSAFEEFEQRFSLIGGNLGVREVYEWIDQVHKGIESRRDQLPSEFGLEWCKSRGEWLMARVFANFLGATFVDAQELIRIKNGGQINSSSYDLVRERLASESGLVVIPGFYGLDEIGQIQTFARGGSDVTGAIVARGINARVYENWTDVDGVLSANPRIVEKPRVIPHITYEEIRELGVRGVEVLQRDTILPLIEVGIPIILRNTFNPEFGGTMIEAQRKISEGEHVIGITSDGPYISFNIQKFGMNDEVGVGRDVLEIFSLLKIPYEHNPSGRDFMSVIVNQDSIAAQEDAILDYLSARIRPDRMSVQRNLGLLSLVGQGIKDRASWVSGRLLSALDDVAIPVRAFTFGTSGISIVVAIDNDRLEDAVRLSHDLFIK